LIYGSPETNIALAPFQQRLHELGYVESQTMVLETRYARGREDRLAELAAELVQLKVDVIYAAGDQVILAAKRATTTIPIIMVACDAVAAGLVSSLAQPGGNITGVTCLSSEIAGKRLALLKEVVPKVSRLGIVWNPTDPGKNVEWKNTEVAAQGLGMHVRSLEVREARDVNRLGAAITRERPDAVVVLGDSLTITNRMLIVETFAKTRVPVIYGYRQFVDAGGMMAYGPNLADMYRRAAEYVDKVLKGARPGDLPVEQPSRFDLVINVKAARALGLVVPPSLTLQAEQIIE
jgi:putative ABC transport system substrate-binding protein